MDRSLSDTGVLRATVKRFYGSAVILQTESEKEITAATNSRSKTLVCGDAVEYRGTDDTCVVVKRLPRHSEFFRTDGFGRTKVIAANVDQILLVLAPLPEPHMQVLDRYWVAARNCDISMCLILNKSDLPDSPVIKEIIALYTQLGLTIIQASAKTADGMTELQAQLAEKTSVFVGPSGVGKSSLVNALSASAGIKTAALSSKKEEGRHTTTTTTFYNLSENARVLDAPGIRQFGLNHYDKAALEHGFSEISKHAEHCRFRDCTHLNTPGCAVADACKRGEIDTRRLNSYQVLLSQLETTG